MGRAMLCFLKRFIAVPPAVLGLLALPAMAQQLPAGWAEVPGDGTMHRYVAGDGSEFVTIAQFDISGKSVDQKAVLSQMIQSLSSTDCATDRIEYSSSHAGRVDEAWLRADKITCGLAVGQTVGAPTLAIIVCGCKWPGTPGFALYARMVDQHFGPDTPHMAGQVQRSAPIPARAAPAPMVADAPTGPVNRSVESTGTTGVWVALTQHTVYDPMMGVRLELGPSYLVLTPGGYFSESVHGPLDDAGAIAHAQEFPDEGGRFSVSGNSLILNYASGERKTASITTAEGSRLYKLDGDRYIPKRVFPDGTRLSGLFSNSSITRASASVFVAGEHDFLFLPDGRFAQGGQVSTMGASFSARGGRDQRTGRYQVRNSTLYLAYDDGEREALSLWQEKPGGPIWFDGAMYEVETGN